MRAAALWLAAAAFITGQAGGDEAARACPAGYAGHRCAERDACSARQADGNYSLNRALCAGGECRHVRPGEYACTCGEGLVPSMGGPTGRRRCCATAAAAACAAGERVFDNKCRPSCRCDGPCLAGCDVCRNGGVCRSRPVLGRAVLSCECPVGFSGESCEIAEFADACDLAPCLNGGTCLPMFARRQCQCTSGFSGESCEIASGEGGGCFARHGCDAEHTAACSDDSTDPCVCAPGWEGDACDRLDPGDDPCASSPCRNGGVCEAIPETDRPVKLVAVGVDSPKSDLFTLTVPDTGFTPDLSCAAAFPRGCKHFGAFAPDGQRVHVQVPASQPAYSLVQVPMPLPRAGSIAAAAGGSFTFRCICDPAQSLGSFCEVSVASLSDGGAASVALRPDDVFGDCSVPGFCCASGGFCHQVFHYARCECKSGWANGAGASDCAVRIGARAVDGASATVDSSPTRPECLRASHGAVGRTHDMPSESFFGQSTDAQSTDAGAEAVQGGAHDSGRTRTQGGEVESGFGAFVWKTVAVSLVLALCCLAAQRSRRRNADDSKEFALADFAVAS